jgi:hypothetical protein
MTTTARLTGLDRRTIARAREVAALHGTDAIREYTRQDTAEGALAAVVGTAQYLLLELAAIAERLDGDG